MKLFDKITIRRRRKNILLVISKYSILNIVFYVFKNIIWTIAYSLVNQSSIIAPVSGLININNSFIYAILIHTVFFFTTYIISFILFVVFTFSLFLVVIKIVQAKKKKYYIPLFLLVMALFSIILLFEKVIEIDLFISSITIIPLFILIAAITTIFYIYLVTSEILSRTSIGRKMEESFSILKTYISYNQSRIAFTFFTLTSIIIGMMLLFVDEPSVITCLTIDSLYIHLSIQIFVVTLAVTGIAHLVYSKRMYVEGVMLSDIVPYMVLLILPLIILMHVLHVLLPDTHSLAPLCSVEVNYFYVI